MVTLKKPNYCRQKLIYGVWGEKLKKVVGVKGVNLLPIENEGSK